MRIKEKEVLVKLNDQQYHCAMDLAMSFLGGKWKAVVLWYLKGEKKRFGELSKQCPQITERMLSITLKQLEADGLILREVYTEKPPLKVKYSLTEFGQSLVPTLNSIAHWGREVAKTKGELVEA